MPKSVAIVPVSADFFGIAQTTLPSETREAFERARESLYLLSRHLDKPAYRAKLHDVFRKDFKAFAEKLAQSAPDRARAIRDALLSRAEKSRENARQIRAYAVAFQAYRDARTLSDAIERKAAEYSASRDAADALGLKPPTENQQLFSREAQKAIFGRLAKASPEAYEQLAEDDLEKQLAPRLLSLANSLSRALGEKSKLVPTANPAPFALPIARKLRECPRVLLSESRLDRAAS